MLFRRINLSQFPLKMAGTFIEHRLGFCSRNIESVGFVKLRMSMRLERWLCDIKEKSLNACCCIGFWQGGVTNWKQGLDMSLRPKLIILKSFRFWESSNFYLLVDFGQEYMYGAYGLPHFLIHANNWAGRPPTNPKREFSRLANKNLAK